MPNIGLRYMSPAVVLLSLIGLTAAAQAQNLPDFTGLVEDTSPAVVKITTRGRVDMDQLHEEEQIPELFREFFERRSPEERDVQSMGSGFFVSEDGYVVTNNHVVEHADEIQVRLIDRREYSAEVVGTDPRSDLALLKIDASDLTYLSFAEEETTSVGEWVLAIGSPFDLDYSVSAGIVSAIGRSIPGPRNGNYVPFIQSDVAINPGHSGGPLFNLDGEVVGVNSQIYTRTGGSIGLSFAVPAILAKDVINQLMETGSVERGWLGVVIQSVDRNLAQSFGLDTAIGALVSQLDPEGPAAQSGLQVGDVIIRYGDQQVAESGELPHMVGRTQPGTEVPIVVVRRGEEQTIDVEIGLLPEEEARAERPEPAESQEGDTLGLVVAPLEEDVGEPGVRVNEVESGSAAARAGLLEGDILTQLGYEEVDTVERYRELAEQLPFGEPVAVRFLRDGQPAFTTITIEE